MVEVEERGYPSDKADKFVVRFPPGMRDRIAAAAKENNRSMNSEIIARLEASFAGKNPVTLVNSINPHSPALDRLAALLEEALMAVKPFNDPAFVEALSEIHRKRRLQGRTTGDDEDSKKKS